MIPNISRGGGARGVLDYVFDVGSRRTGEKNPEVIGGTFAANDPRGIAREFGALRRLRPDIEKPVWHCPLSMADGEHFTSEQWDEFTQKFLEKMGFDLETTAYKAVRHQDKDHDHVHLVVSRIGTDGKIWYGTREYDKAMKACRELERDYGIFEVNNPDYEAERKPLTAKEAAKEEKTGKDSPKREIRKAIDAAIKKHKPKTMPELVEALSKCGVTAMPSLTVSNGKLNGFAFAKGDDVFTGSQLGKKYALAGLIKQGITYDIERDFEWLSAQPQSKSKNGKDVPNKDPKVKIAAAISKALKAKPDGAGEFAQLIAKEGIEIRATITKNGNMSGFSFSVDGQTFKASEISRDYSWSKLQKQGITFDAKHDRKILAEFNRNFTDYNKLNVKPMHEGKRPAEVHGTGDQLAKNRYKKQIIGKHYIDTAGSKAWCDSIKWCDDIKFVKSSEKALDISLNNGSRIVDYGDRIASVKNTQTEIDVILDLAQMKNWSEIEVHGAALFKKQVWIQAQARGIAIKGYDPDQQALKEAIAYLESEADKPELKVITEEAVSEPVTKELTDAEKLEQWREESAAALEATDQLQVDQVTPEQKIDEPPAQEQIETEDKADQQQVDAERIEALEAEKKAQMAQFMEQEGWEDWSEIDTDEQGSNEAEIKAVEDEVTRLDQEIADQEKAVERHEKTRSDCDTALEEVNNAIEAIEESITEKKRELNCEKYEVGHYSQKADEIKPKESKLKGMFSKKYQEAVDEYQDCIEKMQIAQLRANTLDGEIIDLESTLDERKAEQSALNSDKSKTIAAIKDAQKAIADKRKLKIEAQNKLEDVSPEFKKARDEKRARFAAIKEKAQTISDLLEQACTVVKSPEHIKETSKAIAAAEGLFDEMAQLGPNPELRNPFHKTDEPKAFGKIEAEKKWCEAIKTAHADTIRDSVTPEKKPQVATEQKQAKAKKTGPKL